MASLNFTMWMNLRQCQQGNTSCVPTLSGIRLAGALFSNISFYIEVIPLDYQHYICSVPVMVFDATCTGTGIP